MFMRMVQVKAKPEVLNSLAELYKGEIIPALEGTQGCRYAGLMQSAHHPEDCISLTFWDTQRESESYEGSGLFAMLLDKTKPFLAESSESRIQLSSDLKLEYVSVTEEPVVGSFPVTAKSEFISAEHAKHDAMWVRIVSLKVRAGKMEEFRKTYEEQVIPTLREVKGCRYVYLTSRHGKPNEVISVTSWDHKRDAESYEQSGLFDELLEGQENLLSELYQWKRDQENHGGRVVTSEDPVVEYYNVLTGRSFK